MNYKTMLAKVLGEKELMEMNVQTIKDDESLFYKLVALLSRKSGQVGL